MKSRPTFTEFRRRRRARPPVPLWLAIVAGAIALAALAALKGWLPW